MVDGQILTIAMNLGDVPVAVHAPLVPMIWGNPAHAPLPPMTTYAWLG
jgi:hypothetical protein